MMVVGAQRIREAERRAKQTKAGLWHDYTPPASASTKLSDHFSGTVVEVVSGDVVCVKDAASGQPLCPLVAFVVQWRHVLRVEMCIDGTSLQIPSVWEG